MPAATRPLPKVARGDVLAVMSVGAYSFTMSSNYNDRLRAPEVLVDGNRYAVVRERETVDDLLAGIIQKAVNVMGGNQGHNAPCAGKHVHQQPKTLGAARYVFEHHAGAGFFAQHGFRGEADILLPAGALDIFHLAQPVGQNQPFAKVVIGNIASDIATGTCTHKILPVLLGELSHGRRA